MAPYFGCKGRALSIIQIALVVAPAFIMFGYNQANIGGLLTEDHWVQTFPQIDTIHTTGATKKANSTLQGFVVATFVIGAFIGSLSCSYTGDKFGRRNVIFAAAVASLLGEVLEASAFGLTHFIIGRIIIGAGVGQLTSIVPVWLSETSEAKNRGRQVVLTGLFICLGYLLESWIDLAFFEFHTGPVTWRPPIAIAIVFSLMPMAMIYFLPESPRWLVMKGRSEEARPIIAALRDRAEDSLEVQAELAGIEYSLEDTARGGRVKLRDMLTMGDDKLLYRFCLCILLQFFQQMSGSNLVSVYASILFQTNLGMKGELARVLTGGALTWKFLSSFMAFIAIDRFGRRAVFMISGTGMSACMVALAVSTSFPKDHKSAQYAGASFIFLYNTFVPIGFLGANFLYCTEVAPLRLRMAMSSISSANHWLWNFIVVMVTPVALNAIGWRYYLVFAVIAACVPLSVYLFFPETMGRNLEEIDMMFRDSPSVLATVRFARTRRIAMPQEYADEKTRGEDKAAHVEAACRASDGDDKEDERDTARPST